MISDSIKTFASLLLLLLVFPLVANAVPADPYGADGPTNRSYAGPNGWAIGVKCEGNGSDDDCEVSAFERGRFARLIIKSPVLPGVQWYGDIAMMRFPCGTGCRNDMFFSPPDKVDAHELIAENAIDSRRRFVVSVASNPLKVFKLFDSEEPLATLRLATSYSQPVVEKLQWRRNSLEVWYRGDGGELKRASVAIPPH